MYKVQADVRQVFPYERDPSVFRPCGAKFSDKVNNKTHHPAPFSACGYAVGELRVYDHMLGNKDVHAHVDAVGCVHVYVFVFVALMIMA